MIMRMQFFSLDDKVKIIKVHTSRFEEFGFFLVFVCILRTLMSLDESQN